MNCLASFRIRAIRAFGCFLADENGAAAIEYGLMVALISVAIMATIFATGEGIKVTLYDRIATTLSNMM
jgi:pilus assembly protein Flp/PilA